MSVQMGVSEISNSCKFKEEVMCQLLLPHFKQYTEYNNALFGQSFHTSSCEAAH